MSFVEQWQDQVNNSLIECAKLVPITPDVDLKYQLMVVGVLWPICRPVQDFDLEAMEAVNTLVGDRSKYVLQLVQRWEGDQLAVARSLDVKTIQQGELGAALKHLITRFNAFPVFAKQLAEHTRAPQAHAPKTPTSADEIPTQPSINLPKVLVSYIRSDGEQLGTEVRKKLQEDGILVWGNLAQLQGTRNWWQQVTRALDNVDFLVLVMTPSALTSELVRKIWRYAQQQGVCIYPVVKSKDLDFSQLPAWIRQVHFYNLNLEWAKLTASLKGDCRMPRVPFMAEELSDDFINRPVELEQMLASFFDAERQESIAGTVVLHGAGGYGKTFLAKALCHNEDIRQVFNDGILWVSLGENPGDLSRYVIDLIEVLSGERPGFTGLDAAVVRFGEMLADRDILLVIDDVWNAAHLKPFLQGGERCARLITTRDTSVLPAGANTILVDTMRQDQAVALLGSQLPYGHPGRMRQLADHLGNWPLLLKLANGALRDRVYKNHERLREALTYVDNALEKHGITAFDVDNPADRDQAVTSSIDISLELLSEEERMRYNELAIFPEDENIPLATLEKLWGATGGLDDFDTEELCDHLHDLSLLSVLDLTSRHLQLHRVMRSYLVYQQSDNLPALHNQFLQTCSASIKNWADIPPEDTYLWTFLAYHLIEADRSDELIKLVKNLSYLAAKTYIRGVHYAEIDMLAAEEVAPDDKTLKVLRRVLSQTSHLLARCETLNEVANTLHSRFIHLPQLAPLALEAEPDLPRPLLTARHSLPDLPNPALIRTLQGHISGVLDCAVSVDGSAAVSIGKDNALIIWDIESGNTRFNISNHMAKLWGCAISAEGGIAASAFSDGSLALWDTHTGNQLSSWLAHDAGVVSCAISADATTIVSTSKDTTLKVWDTQTATQRHTLVGHHRTVTDCDIDAQGNTIVSTSNDGSLTVWDARTGQLYRTFTINLVKPGVDHLTFQSQRDVNFNCAISADGTLVAGTSSMGMVTVWNIETGAECFSLVADKRGVNGCAFSTDGKMLVAAKSDGNLSVWDATTGTERLTLTDHKRVVNSCAINADGSIIISASDDKTLKVWDGQHQIDDTIAASHTSMGHGCAITPDGTTAVTAMQNKNLVVWDVTTAAEKLILKGHTRKVNGCDISADGTTIVSASQDQLLMVWDAQTGDQRYVLSGHTWSVQGCAVSADGSTIVSASEDKTLKVWGAGTGAERFTLSEHTRAVNNCAISPDGQMIISAGGDGTLKVWNAQTGAKKLTLKGHNAWVDNCAISANGKVILSSSFDKTLKVWSADDPAERRTLQGHTSSATGCALSADGSLAVSVSRDKTIKIWNTQTGQCLTTLFVDEPLVDCACSADAGEIIAVGNSGVYFLRLER